MSVRVREAAAADVATLARLYGEFHSFHVAGVPDLLRNPDPGEANPVDFERQVIAIVADEDALMLLAEERGAAVGFAEAYLRTDERTPFTHERRYVLLQSVGVTTASRGRGAGRALVDAVERWARSRGAVELRLNTWDFDGGPLGFYERLGYTTQKRRLVKLLSR